MSVLVVPVQVAATRRPAPGCAEQLRDWAARLCAAASSHPGSIGSQVDAGPAGITTTLMFSDAAAAARWEQSSDRAALLVEAGPLTHGDPVTPGSPSPPPRWRTALVVWAGLFPFSVLYGVLVGPRLTALPVVLQSLASSAVLVPLAVFVGIPTVTAVLRRSA